MLSMQQKRLSKTAAGCAAVAAGMTCCCSTLMGVKACKDVTDTAHESLIRHAAIEQDGGGGVTPVICGSAAVLAVPHRLNCRPTRGKLQMISCTHCAPARLCTVVVACTVEVASQCHLNIGLNFSHLNILITTGHTPQSTWPLGAVWLDGVRGESGVLLSIWARSVDQNII